MANSWRSKRSRRTFRVVCDPWNPQLFNSAHPTSESIRMLTKPGIFPPLPQKMFHELLRRSLRQEEKDEDDRRVEWSRVNSVLLVARSDRHHQPPSPKQVTAMLSEMCNKNNWKLVCCTEGQLESRYYRRGRSEDAAPTILLVQELESFVPKIGDYESAQLCDLLQLLFKLTRDSPNVVLIGTTYRREMVHDEVLSRFQEEFPLNELRTDSSKIPQSFTLRLPPASASLIWNSLGGLHEVKRQLLQHLDLCLCELENLVIENEHTSNDKESGKEHFTLFRLPSSLRIEAAKGVVLYGRPGTGKTLIVKALAELRGVPLQSVSLAELLASDVGEAERNLREAFSVPPPHIIFVDELQAIFVKRGEDRSHAQMLTTQFFLLLDSLPKGVMVIGATNVPSSLDASMIAGRLILIEVPPPSPADRVTIFRSITQKMPLAADVIIEQVSNACPGGTTGAEVHFVCRTAAMAAISANSPVITSQHFQTALKDLQQRQK